MCFSINVYALDVMLLISKFNLYEAFCFFTKLSTYCTIVHIIDATFFMVLDLDAWFKEKTNSQRTLTFNLSQGTVTPRCLCIRYVKNLDCSVDQTSLPNTYHRCFIKTTHCILCHFSLYSWTVFALWQGTLSWYPETTAITECCWQEAVGNSATIFWYVACGLTIVHPGAPSSQNKQCAHTKA